MTRSKRQKSQLKLSTLDANDKQSTQQPTGKDAG
jgi:hypothetical protein